MEYTNLSIVEINKALKEGKVTPKELFEEAISKAKKYQKDYNCFVNLVEDYQDKEYDFNNKLAGIPFAAKDNFSTKGILTTGSSNILKDYVPVFNATVIEKLAKSGCNLMGKTVLDELAMGGSGTTANTGLVHNPYDLSRMSGGSSAGSAVAVALGIVPFALGSDTGDSVRKPASLCGIVGFKPSWGRISRFGLFPFAASLDHVAYFTRTVADSALVLEELAGRDENDATSSFKEVATYYENLNENIKGKKIAIIKGIVDNVKDPKVKEIFDKSISCLKELGAIVSVVEIDEKLLKAIYPTYMIISCAEATSNNANLDGIKFGVRKEGKTSEEVMLNTRTAGFGELIKRRFVLGSYALAKENQERLFLRAQKVRRRIVNEVNEILKEYEAIVLPASGDIAPKFDDNAEKLSDAYLIVENHLAIANFAGLPSITIPNGFKDGLPLGINITGRLFDEQTTLNIAYALEKKINLKAGGLQ